jgi:transposase
MTENDTPVMKKRGRPRIHPKSVPYTKVGKQGVPLRSQSRELVCRVKDYFQQEKINKGPILPVEQVINRTAAALNIYKNTVVKVCKEKKLSEESGTKLRTPNKKIAKTKRVTGLDAFQKDAVRRHVYGYFSRKEYPTVKKLHVSLAESGLLKASKSSIATVLKGLGFKYKKFGNRKVLMERGDIVAWRCKFLREIKDKNFDQIIWLDETWVNAGHCQMKGWTDDTAKGTFPIPVGKGGRIIVLHAGCSTGFIPNCLLLFTSKKTNEYHEEMNHNVFKNWFQQSLIPNLSRPSIIIMDNAKYHSKIIDKPPNSSTRKEAIIDWLRNHNVSFTNDLLKVELLELVKINKPPTRYEVDEIAKTHGHRVVRLPPYHCHFNSIELIWAQVKGYVAKHNKKFTVAEVVQLTEEAIQKVTESDWKKVVDHTKQTIMEAWTNEGLMEHAVDQMIINVNGEDDSSSEEEDWNSDSEVDGNSEEEAWNSDNEADGDKSDFSGVSPLSPVNERELDFEEF